MSSRVGWSNYAAVDDILMFLGCLYQSNYKLLKFRIIIWWWDQICENVNSIIFTIYNYKRKRWERKAWFWTTEKRRKARWLCIGRRISSSQSILKKNETMRKSKKKGSAIRESCRILKSGRCINKNWSQRRILSLLRKFNKSHKK